MSQPADDVAVVIAFPHPPTAPDWALIDQIAAELGLWHEPPRLCPDQVSAE